jgi:hypothetical protein
MPGGPLASRRAGHPGQNMLQHGTKTSISHRIKYDRILNWSYESCAEKE